MSLSRFWTEENVKHIMSHGKVEDTILLEIALQLSKLNDNIDLLRKDLPA